MVDALDSKSSGRKAMRVRPPPPAPFRGQTPTGSVPINKLASSSDLLYTSYVFHGAFTRGVMMKKLFVPVSFAFLLLIFSPQVFADEIKFITLSDGSVIKGEVVNVDKSTYTVKTPNMGTLKIKGADIESITKDLPDKDSNTISDELNPTELKDQVGIMQGKLLNDPALMEDLKDMMQDEEVMKIISSKDFITTIMSYDQDRIKNNAQTQELMNNPKIRELMIKMEQKLGQE